MDDVSFITIQETRSKSENHAKDSARQPLSPESGGECGEMPHLSRASQQA
jgi:hypothetical protein